MVSRAVNITGIVILAILPYSTVLSNFSPYLTTHSFRNYLVACLVFAIVSLLIGLAVSSKRLFKSTGCAFFLLGMITAPPFMIGPPELSPALLERTTEEHFRYGLLLLASIVFITGAGIILKSHWKQLSVANKYILLPLALCGALMLWDNFSSYNFSAALTAWVNKGMKADEFFIHYNFHEFLRTLGRSLLYVLIPWLAFIQYKNGEIKKWHTIALTAFSAVGILFFFLTNFIGMQFYFPFMVPAVALAPAYWLGLMLIVRKQ